MQSVLSLSIAPLASQQRRSRLRVVPRILLADDCPFQRLLGLALLSRWNIFPELASNGQEALVLASEQDFDIILMDLEMPVVDGFAATEGIRQRERLSGRRKRVPVVAYTANDSASSDGRWLRSGMDALMAKPAGADDMGECLRRWCPSRLLVDKLAASA